jgi:hypothetical protein
MLLASPPPVAWGPASSEGLQLGCWLDARAALLRCALRNQGPSPVRVSTYRLGDAASLTVRPAHDALAPALLATTLSVLSAGAVEADLRQLRPGRYLRARGDPGSDALLSQAFTVSLASLAPHDHELQVVVTQSLGDDGVEGGWAGTLRSGPVAVPPRV